MITEDTARELWQAMGGRQDYSPAYFELVERARALHRTSADLPGEPHGPGLTHRGGSMRHPYPAACCGQTMDEAMETADTWTADDDEVTCPRFSRPPDDGRCRGVLYTGQRCQLRRGHRESYHIADADAR